MTKPVAPGCADGAAGITPPSDFLTGFVTEAEYASRRGVSIRTCQRDRQLRCAPPHVKIGSKIYYRVDSIRRWLDEREAHAGRSPAAPRTRRGRV
jgi:hypothetical protein